jgi:predicted AAA+ superfamily ATPase
MVNAVRFRTGSDTGRLFSVLTWDEEGLETGANVTIQLVPIWKWLLKR